MPNEVCRASSSRQLESLTHIHTVDTHMHNARLFASIALKQATRTTNVKEARRFLDPKRYTSQLSYTKTLRINTSSVSQPNSHNRNKDACVTSAHPRFMRTYGRQTTPTTITQHAEGTGNEMDRTNMTLQNDHTHRNDPKHEMY